MAADFGRDQFEPASQIEWGLIFCSSSAKSLSPHPKSVMFYLSGSGLESFCFLLDLGLHHKTKSDAD